MVTNTMENRKIGFILLVWALICVSALQIVKSQNRITNGFIARPHQFPWHVVLKNSKMEAYCGGSLIDPRWVLTAAQCVKGRKSLYVMYGTYQLNNDSAPVVIADEIFAPNNSVIQQKPKFAIRHDIALIKLPRQVKFDVSVQVIPLVSASEKHKDFAEETAIIEGFGSTNGQYGNYSNDLMYGYVLMKHNKPCIGGPSTNIFFHDNKNTVLCSVSSSNEEKICYGDSGGPLIFEEVPGRFVQIGINSYVSGSCFSNNVIGFSKVAAYLGWISEITGIIFD